VSLQAGEIVGAYRISGLIGSGGAGQVFKVEHVITRRVEAIKVLSGRTDAREQADRFLREIQIQASLSHPNIASVHNAFWAGDDLVMVMELVDGEPLKRILERGPLPLETALDYAGQTLSALEYAHAHHVTHRDITPGNMLVTPAGRVKLTDFGLAKSATDLRLTQTGAVLGSLYYMSPEQVRADRDLDLRTDIYSMGAVLYEMVTGARPFKGESAFAVMTAHIGEAPLPLSTAFPSPLNSIVLKALAKDPAQRFQSAEEFRVALESVREAGVRKSVPAALRWAIGAVAVCLAAFLLNSGKRNAAVPATPIASIAPVTTTPVTTPAVRSTKPAPSVRTPRSLSANGEVWATALSPSGKWLAAGTEDRSIEIWNVMTGEKHATLRGHTAGVTAVCFSHDEKSLASGSADRTVKLWDIRSKAERKNFRASGMVTAVALSGDGRWLAAGSADKKVKLWNLKEEGKVAGFREKRESSALAFSPDGRLLAVAGGDSLRLRTVNNGREVRTFSRPGAAAVTFGHDGHCLAVSATPKGVKLWDTATSRELAAIPFSARVRTLAVDPNGTVAIASGVVVSIWNREKD
jgi:serine/threonine protein kinase